MNLSMYCDSSKNLMMFLPDNVTDEEILELGKVAFPEFESPFKTSFKPTAILDLSNFHADYPIDQMTPTEFTTF